MSTEAPGGREFYDTSKYKDELWFPDTIQTDVVFYEKEFPGYALEGRIVFNKEHSEPWVLSVHGARADFTKSDEVTQRLQERGFSLLGMSLSGHNNASPLQPEQTTLQNNIDEVEAFFEDLDSDRPKAIIAYSLGGTPALKLLEHHASEIDKLVLFYPGVYAKNAYDKSYGSAFKEAITQPFSYRENDTIELLRRYQGKLLLIKGQYDGLNPVDYGLPEGGSVGEVTIDGERHYSPIPEEVIDLVYNAVPDDRRQLIEVPGCGHAVVAWMREHPQEAQKLVDTVQSFLTDD